MKKIILILLLFNFNNSHAQVFSKNNLVIQPFYGTRIKDYIIPSAYKEKGVNITNTNTIGVKINYFIKDLISLGFQIDYKKRSMQNDEMIYHENRPFTFELSGNLYNVYYSPTNGFASSEKTSFRTTINFHILNQEKITCTMSFGMGYIHEVYKSSVSKEEEESFSHKETILYDDVELENTYTYQTFPSRNIIPFGVSISTNINYKISEKMGATMELGIGNYNLALGLFYKLK